LGAKKGSGVDVFFVASVFMPLARHDSARPGYGWLCFADCTAARESIIASINRAATMRATTLVLLVAGAAALQPTLRVHAAARPLRTSASPVQKTTKGINDLVAKRFL
jgi:hypothetical protein